jgi:hypothetical protein
MVRRRISLVHVLLALLGASAQNDDMDDDIVGNENSGYLMPNPPPPPSSGGSSSSCVFRAPTGEAFDLTPMKRDDHDFTGTTTGGYAYRFNVCGNTVKLCNAQPAPASKWRGTKCNNLGDPSTQTVSLLDSKDPSAGVRLKYTQGDICKRQVNGQMEISSRLISYDVKATAPRRPRQACTAIRTRSKNARCCCCCAVAAAAATDADADVHGWCARCVRRSRATLLRTRARCG